jgi:hypothetical protein
VVYFFGGQSKKNRREEINKSQLNKLVIEWNRETGHPCGAKIVICNDVIFPGNPTFNQNIVNKRFFAK